MNSNPGSGSIELYGLNRRSTQYAILGVVAGIAFPLLASVIKVVELGLPVNVLNLLSVQFSEPLLWITDTAPFFLGVVAGIAGRRQDLIEESNQSLKERETELTQARASLEKAVQDRTLELDKRNSQMRTVVEFARQVADIQDLNALLNVAADIIGERFPHFETNLYLMEENAHAAVLRASSSLDRKALAKQGSRVPLNDQSPVGRVARRGKLMLQQARQEKPTSMPATVNPPTGPGTQVTIPLVVRGRVIGVLDLKSREQLYVGASETEIFQLIADQLAASIENAQLVTASRNTLQQLETLASQGTRAAWQEYLKNRDIAYQFTPAGVALSTVSVPSDANTLGTPLVVRGQPIGELALRRRNSSSWSQADKDLAEKVAAQVALALENARLLEETSQKAAQEQIISEISARLNRSLEVDAVLQAAAREFAALPEVAEAEVRLAGDLEKSN